MASFKTKNAEINFEIWGEELGPHAPWLTLVNGHTRPLNDFRMAGKFFVEQGFKCLALDNRGAGLSTYVGSFTYTDLAADVVELWRHLEIAKSNLLGISMGGFIAQTIAKTSEQVSKLVLVSTGPSRTAIDDAQRPWGDSLETVQAKMAQYFTESFRERNKMLVTSMSKQILKGIQGGSFLANSQAQAEAIAGFDESDLGNIKAPTLVIHGELDQVIPINAAHALHDKISNAGLEVIPGVGHLLLAECPKQLYNIVSDFISDSKS